LDTLSVRSDLYKSCQIYLQGLETRPTDAFATQMKEHGNCAPVIELRPGVLFQPSDVHSRISRRFQQHWISRVDELDNSLHRRVSRCIPFINQISPNLIDQILGPNTNVDPPPFRSVSNMFSLLKFDKPLQERRKPSCGSVLQT
jgi:hypothetical protein